ncbi:squalene epoxidase-domain-containing protein [Kockovaella imperatae]|uniref:Squalene monooxygenase n=1 Tax=Kockovaella imperatae TaxID=4999 RepID=A0A1Y1URZ5_9TREE|nr:squalene epoxidase-domain-containing protein [Kockovaella imperatae]ORX40274.1 squalene epoxidase-domain-containing protein [Kockovaella imperatae]
MDHNSDTSSTAGPSRRRTTHHDLHHLSPEIIVIGAGIAGSALSYALSHSGRKVLLLERDLSEPDRIVGELLQPGGVNALSKIGLANVLEGIDATPVEGYTITTGVGGERKVACPYPTLEGTDKNTGKGSKAGGDDEIRANGHVNNGLSTGEAGSGLRHRHSNGYTNGGQLNGDTSSAAAQWHVESASGRKEGRSFHHGRLIMSLRNRCIDDAPNCTVLEATVKDLIYCDHSSHVIGVNAAFKVPKAGSESSGNADIKEEMETVERKVYAPLTIIADGCFSKFRSIPGSRLPPTQTRSTFVGAIVKDIDLPAPRRGTVCLTPSGPVLLYQIGYEARETRMLVDVKGKLPSAADGSLKRFIIDNYVPYLPTNVQPAVTEAVETQRLRTMPNSFLPPSMQGLSGHSLRGAIMVGDAYNMRHPLTGGGMTVAFNDAVILSDMLAPGGRLNLKPGREGLEDWETIAGGLRDWFWERKHLAGVVNVLSMALYDLFGGADHPEFSVLQAGCFKYLGLGGEQVAGPVGLLSAITPKPLLLFYHFFAVALYSIYLLFKQGPPAPDGKSNSAPGILAVPNLMWLSMRTFWTACVVLLPVIWTEFKI